MRRCPANDDNRRMTVAPSSQPTHNRRLVAWLSLGQLITWGSVFYTFALLMEPVERELGLTRAQSSLAFSLALLAEGALAYPVGRWIDRGHERAVMTGGSLLVGLCLLLHSAVQSRGRLLRGVDRLGAGLAATLYNPVFAVVTRRFPDDFRRAIITLTFLGGLASTVFIPLSAWLDRRPGLAPRAVGLGGVPPAAFARRCTALSCAAHHAAARAAPGDSSPPARLPSICAARPFC